MECSELTPSCWRPKLQPKAFGSSNGFCTNSVKWNFALFRSEARRFSDICNSGRPRSKENMSRTNKNNIIKSMPWSKQSKQKRREPINGKTTSKDQARLHQPLEELPRPCISSLTGKPSHWLASSCFQARARTRKVADPIGSDDRETRTRGERHPTY